MFCHSYIYTLLNFIYVYSNRAVCLLCTCLFIHVLCMNLKIFLIGTCKVLHHHCHKHMLTTKCLFATNTPIANILLTRHRGFCQMTLSHWMILSMHCSKPFPNFCMLNLHYCKSCFETRKSATINYSHLNCEPHTCK